MGRAPKPPPSRYRRTPDGNSLGVPYGCADLPVELHGEIVAPGTDAERFEPHATPREVDQLWRPWTGARAHPRSARAAAMIRSGLADELGWRAAWELVA